MHTPRFLATTVAALLAGSSAHAVDYYWDTVAGDGASITAGSGFWNTTAGNTVWNNAGTNVIWANDNKAIFGGLDGTENAYTVTLAAGFTVAGMSFESSGYNLTAASARTITLSSGSVSVATGKTATIGTNVTVAKPGLIVGGGGLLKVAGGISGTSTSASQITDGTTVEILAGGLANFSASVVVGANAAAANQDGTLIVNGGTVNATGASTNFVIGNLATGTTNATVTLNSGAINIGSTSADGLRFGSNAPSTGGVINGVFNLNGGTFTTPQIKRYSPGTGGVKNGTFNFNGGLLVANKSNTAFMQNLTAANVQAGGARISSGTFDITIAQNLLDGGGGGGLEKLGTGSLILSGDNTYTGTTTVTGGTLQVGVGGTAGSLAGGAILNNGLLIINRSNAYALGNNISGSGGINFTGAGTITLGGTNTYTGATNVNTGRVNLGGSLTSNITVADSASFGGEGSTTGSLTFLGTTTLFFDPSTAGSLTANSVVATGALINLSITAASPAATGIVVINAPGGITGTAGAFGNFQFTGRGTAYLNGTGTQLLFDYTPATLKWKGTDATNPTFWDVNTTVNWDNAGTPDKFLTADVVVFDDTASSFTVDLQGAPQSSLVTFNNSANTYTIQGALTGGGALVKNGTGLTILTSDNTYAGTTTINEGTLQIGNGGTTGTLGGGSVVNNGTLVFNRSAQTVTNAISGTGSLVKSGSGLLTLGTSNTYSGLTTINGGAILVNANSGILGNTTGGTVVSGTGAALQLQGGITTGEALTLTGEGTNALTSPGALRNISGNNEWTGDITILPTPITRISSDAGNLKLSGNIALISEATDQFVVQGNGTGEISGVISGASRITRSVTGSGTWTLSGANTYTGKTTVSGGFLSVSSLNSVVGGQASSGLGAPTDVASGTIDLGGSGFTGGILYTGSGETTDRTVNLSGNGIIDQSGIGGVLAFSTNLANTGTGSRFLTLRGSTAGTGEFNGSISNGAGIVGLIKAGTGKWTLTGINSYSGPTNITGGTLAIANGASIGQSASINISGGAILDVSAVTDGLRLNGTQTLTGGAGTSAGIVNGPLVAAANAILSPGASTGTTGILSLSNGLTLDAGSHLAVDLNGTTAGTGYDQVIVNGGNISLSGDLSGSTVGFAPNFHDTFYILLNNGLGTTTGTFGGIAEGGVYNIGGQDFIVSYTSDFGGAGFTLNGSGNDVALLAVPEPSAVVTMLAGLGVMLGLRRRRL